MLTAVAEIRAAYPEHKRRFNAQYLWWHHVMETPAIYLAAVALRLGLTANQVTAASLVVAVAGCLTIASDGITGRVAGLLLLVIWQWMDDVDGHLARTRRQGSPLGAFLDESGAHLVYVSLFFALGVSLAIRPESSSASSWLGIAHGASDALILAIGACAGTATAFRTVLADLYAKVAPRAGADTGEEPGALVTPQRPAAGLSALYRWYHLNVLELPGFVVPLLLAASIAGYASELLLFYAICWAMDVVIVFVVHARRLSAPNAWVKA